MEEKRYTYTHKHTRPHTCYIAKSIHSLISESLTSGVTIVSMAAGVKQNQAPGMQAASTNIF